MTPTACPDGKEVETACTSAEDGRGRSLSRFPASVIRPINSTLTNRNTAVDRLRRSTATMISPNATIRNAIGPKATQKASQNRTQPG